MVVRKVLAIFPIVVLILVGALVACQSAGMGGAPSSSDVDYILRGTVVAGQVDAAQTSAAAFAAEVAAVTAQAAQTSSAATSSWQATTDAWNLAVEQGNATATTAAQGTADSVTATWVQMSLDVEATEAEATAIVRRQVIQSNEDLLAEEKRIGEARARREEIMGYLSLGATAVAIVIGLTMTPIVVMRLLNYFTKERRRIEVINGQPILPANMYQSLPRPPRLLEQHEHLALPAGDDEEEYGEMPTIVELPRQLTQDRIGIGVEDGRPGNALYMPADRFDVLGAGAPDQGKSTLAHVLAYQAIMLRWHVVLIDAEHVTFKPRIWGPVARHIPDATQAISECITEFDRRFALYEQAEELVMSELPPRDQFYVDKLVNYNRAAELFGMEILRPILVVGDEFNNIMGHDKVFDEVLFEFLRRRRKAGCGGAFFGHLWHASQVGPEITALLTTRFVLRCEEKVSRVVLGSPDGARVLTRPGQAIVIGSRGSSILQTYYLPAERVFSDISPDRRLLLPTAGALPPVNNMGHLPAGNNGNGHSNGNTIIVSGHSEEDRIQRDILHRYYVRSQSLTGIANDLFGSRGGPGFSERVRPTVVDTPVEEVIRILGEQYRAAIMQRHAAMLESLRT